MRRWIGRPGSLRRWFAGSAALLFLSLAWFKVSGSFVPLLFSILAVMFGFVARGAVVGDEDEFNASLDQALVRALREGVPAAMDDAPLDRDEIPAQGWCDIGAPPPPPAVEMEQAVSDLGQGHRP
jgi:hypothetical protein